MATAAPHSFPEGVVADSGGVVGPSATAAPCICVRQWAGGWGGGVLHSTGHHRTDPPTGQDRRGCSAAFDAVSHVCVDAALEAAGASHKTRALAREVCKQATAVARDREVRVDVARGCLQGCVLNPLLSCLMLAIVLEDVAFDPVEVDQLCVDHLACADDVALMTDAVGSASKTSQAVSGASKDEADVFVDVEETESTKVKWKAVLPQTTTEEVDGLGPEAACECCHETFFTDAGLRLHDRQRCRQARVPNWEGTLDVGLLADVCVCVCVCGGGARETAPRRVRGQRRPRRSRAGRAARREVGGHVGARVWSAAR